MMYLDESGGKILEADMNDFDSWVGRLKPLGLTSNLIICPATTAAGKPVQDSGAAGTASAAWWMWPSTAPHSIYGSFAMNGWFFSYDQNSSNAYWDTPAPALVVNNPAFMFGGGVQRPSLTPLFLDAVYWNLWPLETDKPAFDLSTGQWNNVIGIPRCTIWRHGGKTLMAPYKVSTIAPIKLPGAINIGFADGHAQLVKLQNLWSLYWHRNWKP